MPFAPSNGIKINWEELGEGDPVLLVMGLGYTLDMWHRTAPMLAERHRVVMFDNRGVGQSDVPEGPYTIPQMAGDAVAVLDAAGIDRTHVVGASMGGMIAQRIAIAHPERVRSLVLACTTCGGPGFVPAAPDVYETLQARATMSPEDGVRATIPFTYGADTPAERIEEDLAIRLRTFPAPQGYLAQLQASLGYDAHDEVGAIRAPTLVIHGDADRLIPPENGRDLAARIPGARLEILPGSSHILFTDRTDDVNRLLLGFLREHEKGGT